MLKFFSWKVVLILVLAVAAIASVYHSYSYYQNNKEGIVVGAADILYMLALPYRIAELSAQPPPEELLLPIKGIAVSDVEDTWGAPRPGGRDHKGIDIFADSGTPLYASAPGYIVRKGTDNLGGIILYISGAGGWRYYYAHLRNMAFGLELGTYVTTETVIGYVGNTGNASTTPPHLHFELHVDGDERNPYQLFRSREE